MKIFLAEYIHPEAVARLKEKAEITDRLEDIGEVEGIILRTFPVDRGLMEKAKKLKVVAKHGVGYNTIDIEAAKEYGITVTFTPRANTNSVAELIAALILDVARNVSLADRKSRGSEWTRVAPAELSGTEISGKTLGLIGMGNIARRVAGIMRGGFQADIVGYDPYVTGEAAAELGIRKRETVEEVLREADIVNISVPLTEDTRNLISARNMDCFKPGAILINASRGGIVNEADLYEALKSGRLRGAACDAFESEPPTGDNPLLALDNFVATPHIGADTEDALYRMGMEAVEAVLDTLEGREPKYRVV